MNATQWIIGVLGVLLVAGGVYWTTVSGEKPYTPPQVDSTSFNSTINAPSSLSTSPSDVSSSAIDKDLGAIDQQLNSLDGDASDIDAGVEHAQSQ